MNAQRLQYLKRKVAKLLTPEGLGKAISSPSSVLRAIRQGTTDRNLRNVPAQELLADSLAAIAALARISGPPASQWQSACDEDTAALGELYRRHGSDKSTEHDYYEVYGAILSGKRQEPLHILEIGLGTNNLAFQSNMGLGGRPGASLRAIRDWAPFAQVVGADIDEGVLFQENRIETHGVDQTIPASLFALAAKLGDRRFDLIIDDGLHLPHANFNTIEALLPLLSECGSMVVEDIDPIHLDYWWTASKVLNGFETRLLERKGGWMFLIGRLPHRRDQAA